MPNCLRFVVVAFVLASLSTAGHAACPPGRGWSSDPVCGNDIVTVGFAGRVGFWVAGPRWRWEGFQWELFEVRGSRPLAGPFVAQTQGILGVGWKIPLGAERRHEIGLLVYPLSIGWTFRRADPHDDVVGSTGMLLAEALSPEIEGTGVTTYVDARLTYRYTISGMHLEVGVAMPLVWVKSALGEFDTSGPYRGSPPIDLVAGVGF